MIFAFDVLLAQPTYPNISAVFVQLDHLPSCRKASFMHMGIVHKEIDLACSSQ